MGRSLCTRVLVVGWILSTGLAGGLPRAAGNDGHFSYPPYGAWRGRMVYRDGPFHVERYRWGNGLTPTGGAVAVHGMTVVGQVAGQVLPVVLGGRELEPRDADSDRARSRSATLSSNEDYIREQQRANNLLERATRLLDGLPTKPDTTKPESVQPPPAVPSTGPALQKMLEGRKNPWDAISEGNH